MATYYAANPYDVSVLKVRLQAEIQAHDEPGLWMALVDTAFNHGSKKPSWLTEACPVYHQGRLALMQSVSPVLLALHTENDAEFEATLVRLLSYCRGQPMLSFLHTTRSPQALRESWQSVLEIETESGQSFVLRFADMRITPSIATALVDNAWIRLSHGVDRWLGFNREGNLQELPITHTKIPINGPQETVRIGSKALAQLLKLGQADALANALEEHFPDLLLPQTQGALMYQQLNATCELAEKHNIEAFPDLMSLAVSVRLSEGRLLEDADFERWLQERSWVSLGMASALADYLDTEKVPD